jgi:hypothetical protein
MNLQIVGAGALVLFLCSGATRAEAQNVASSFEQLATRVETGDTITVVDVFGRETKGQVWNVSRDALIFGTSTGPRQLGEADVAMISQRRDDSLKNGAIIGAVSATALFVTVGTLLRDRDGGDVIVSGAIAGGVLFAGMGAAAGLGIDALITRRQLIYPKPAGRRGISVSPVFGRGRRGGAVTITF